MFNTSLCFDSISCSQQILQRFDQLLEHQSSKFEFNLQHLVVLYLQLVILSIFSIFYIYLKLSHHSPLFSLLDAERLEAQEEEE